MSAPRYEFPASAYTVRPIARDPATMRYFDAAAQGHLLILRCTFCDTASDAMAAACRQCGSPSLVEQASSGEGTVMSWSVVHRRPSSTIPARTVLVIIALDEGPWWWAQLNCDVDTRALTGARARAVFVQSGPAEDDEWIVAFELIDGSNTPLD